MIVDPDFFEHWRTRMLIDALGADQMAPMYIMRIWAHCQSRRATSFAMPPAGLKALCRFPGDANSLETAMCEAGFIERNGDSIDVPAWAEHNSKLIANWENGGKGGRPKKTEEEPNETQSEPTETQQEPIRVEKIREEKKGEERSKAKASRTARKPAKTPLPPDFSISDAVRDWAAKNGHANLQAHFESFVGKSRANGYVYADWDQALQNAIRDDWAKLNTPQARAGPPSKSPGIAEQLEARKNRGTDQRIIDLN